MAGSPRISSLSALGFQSGYATGHAVNLLAANGAAGAVVSGSGIWPADPDAPAIQNFDTRVDGRWSDDGWLGVLDLVSADSSGDAPPNGGASLRPRPLPSVAAIGPLPALGEKGTVNAMWFDAVSGARISVRAAAGGITCDFSADQLAGNATYALVAAAGLTPLVRLARLQA